MFQIPIQNEIGSYFPLRTRLMMICWAYRSRKILYYLSCLFNWIDSESKSLFPPLYLVTQSHITGIRGPTIPTPQTHTHHHHQESREVVGWLSSTHKWNTDQTSPTPTKPSHTAALSSLPTPHLFLFLDCHHHIDDDTHSSNIPQQR